MVVVRGIIIRTWWKRMKRKMKRVMTRVKRRKRSSLRKREMIANRIRTLIPLFDLKPRSVTTLLPPLTLI